MSLGVQVIANGSIYLDHDLVTKYKGLPDTGKNELRRKWMKKFIYKTPRRLERIIARHEKTSPTPDQFSWLKTMIEHYYVYYSPEVKPVDNRAGATA